MTILNRQQIINQMGDRIEPFNSKKVKEGISYGLGHFGYDISMSPEEFLVFPQNTGATIDPKEFNKDLLLPALIQRSKSGDYFILPGNTYALCSASERISMPDDLTGICLGKSTYARCGIIVNMTPVEAGWSGYLTIEISNSCGCPARIYANEGIAQILFLKGDPCDMVYDGKYQNQTKGVTTARALPKSEMPVTAKAYAQQLNLLHG